MDLFLHGRKILTGKVKYTRKNRFVLYQLIQQGR